MILKGIIVLVFIILSSSAHGQVPMQLGWYSIPNTRLDVVCQANPDFNTVKQVEGCNGITLAWNSAVFDRTRNRLILWGGGHNAYSGNELYALNLGSTLTLERLNPSAVPFNRCAAANPDGTPTARHTQDQVVYVEHADTLFNKGGAYDCANGGLNQDAWSLDLGTVLTSCAPNCNEAWTQKNISPQTTGNTFNMVYDPATRLVWSMDDNGQFRTYNADTDTWSVKATTGAGSSGSRFRRTAVIDPIRRLFISAGNSSSSGGNGGTGLEVWDIKYATPTRAEWTTTGPQNCQDDRGPGLAYDEGTGTVVCWTGGNSIYRLNVDTRVWTQETYSIATGHAQNGPAQVGPNGSYKRFAYSRTDNMFVICEYPNENCFALRTSVTTPPLQDFVRRCETFGVKRCWGFDDASTFTDCGGTANGCFGSDFGKIGPSSNPTDFTRMTQDTAQKTSGASSLRARIPTNTPQDTSGSWHTNFHPDFTGQIGGNASLYVQYRVRFSPCLLYPGTDDANCAANGAASPLIIRTFDHQSGSGNANGWKYFLISTGDLTGNGAGSCQPNDLAMENSVFRGIYQAYHSCVTFQGFEPTFSNPDIGGQTDIYLTQNLRPSTFCSFSHGPTGGLKDGFYPPGGGNCEPLRDDDWTTIQVGLDTGPFQTTGCSRPPYEAAGSMSQCFKNTRFRMWVVRADGVEELLADHTRDWFATDANNGNNLIGKVWLLPYHTNKDSKEVHPEMYMWWDELIISTAKIVAPGAAATFGPSSTSSGNAILDGNITLQ